MKTDTKFLRDFVRYNGLAWPGGYPMVLIMWDCNVIDAQSARENYRQILRATRHPGTDRQWQAIGTCIYWEGEPMECAHSGRMIESAYGVPE